MGIDAPIKQTPSRICVQGVPIAIRGSCGSCGTPLFMRYHCRPDGTSVVMGIVDDASVVGDMPHAKEHIFLQEKAAWWNVPGDDGLARHEAFNETFQIRLKEWAAKGYPLRPDAGCVTERLEGGVQGSSEAKHSAPNTLSGNGDL